VYCVINDDLYRNASYVKSGIFSYFDPLYSTIDFYTMDSLKPTRMVNFVAAFEKVFKKAGVQKIQVFAQIKNTLTGESTRSTSDYTVNVLEK
jgi:hypothetical protein